MPTLAPLRLPTSTVEVEICGPNNNDHFFEPAGRVLRGHKDFARVTSTAEIPLRTRWPDPVPGKIVGVSADGETYVREPLHDAANVKLKMLIQSRGMTLEDERETFRGDTAITWLYWMARLVDAGLGRVVKGELPPLSDLEPPRKTKPVDPRIPRKDFIFAPPDESLAEQILAAVKQLADNTAKNTQALERLIAGK